MTHKEVNGGTLKQIEKFKYLEVASTSDERLGEELYTQIGLASAIMQAFHYSVIMKRELSKTKLWSLKFQNSFSLFPSVVKNFR